MLPGGHQPPRKSSCPHNASLCFYSLFFSFNLFFFAIAFVFHIRLRAWVPRLATSVHIITFHFKQCDPKLPLLLCEMEIMLD